MDGKTFDWIPFYTELAEKLQAYRTNRPLLIEMVRRIYQEAGFSLPHLEADGKIDDIDPFTVFGFFNKNMKDANRMKIAGAIRNAFQINAPTPTAFQSAPVLNPLNANFFPFREKRQEGQMDSLWELFNSALRYARNPSGEIRENVAKAFDQAVAMHHNGIGKITMALYWIAPDTFLNLDSRNRWYIYESGEMPADFTGTLPPIEGAISGHVYFDIIDRLSAFLKSGESPLKNFSELSYEAWHQSQDVNNVLKEASQIHGEDQKGTWLYTVYNEESWNDCLQHGIFYIGMDNIGDLRQYKTKEEIRQALIQTYGDQSNRTMQALMSFNFAHLMKPGDTVFAKRKNTIVGKGTVSGDYVHAPDRNEHRNIRTIQWEISGKWNYPGKLEAKRLTDITNAPKLIKNLIDTMNGFQIPDVPDRDDKGDALGDNDVQTKRYWVLSPGQNASLWDSFCEDGLMAIGWNDIGDLSAYATKQEMKEQMQETIDPDMSFKNDAHATWQFAKEIQPGDIVYAKRGLYQIIGRGIVTSEYIYNPEWNAQYPNIRYVNWTHKGEWNSPKQLIQKTLTDITPFTDTVAVLEALFESEDTETVTQEEPTPEYPAYDEEQFLSEVYMDRESYITLTGLVRNKKNVILQGAPGVGKTYTAKRLAYSMMGVKDQDRIMLVQFHQSYSYEDFIEGFRPAGAGGGFEIKKGAFYHFCRKAAEDPENEYFFIIDEINRGNLSKIFGELFMLIENDKRGNALQLLYSDEKFFVPKNVYIIGMMNTADRSLAMLDYALRRRFSFFDMKPGFDTAGFRAYRKELASEKFDRLITCVQSMNDSIAEDESLGEGFFIGHSYFCNLEKADDASLRAIVDYELAPLVKEYWYDDRGKAADWISRLKEAIQ